MATAKHTNETYRYGNKNFFQSYKAILQFDLLLEAKKQIKYQFQRVLKTHEQVLP